MSLALSLIQGYSSPEEEDEEEDTLTDDLRQSSESSDGDEVDDDPSAAVNRSIADRTFFDLPQPSASGLPSAFQAFSEVSAPPDFLNNSVEEYGRPKREVDLQPQYHHHHHHRRHGRRKHNKDKKDLPAGAVMESKAHLVGIHERVRSDMEGNLPPKSVSLKAEPEAKRVITAANPNAEDAADLLRMCLQCGIPKTYTSAKGMVCPVCGDRPPADLSSETKKKGSAVKDKEKNKRMKGQSSHATWKSETEMHLRQQFD